MTKFILNNIEIFKNVIEYLKFLEKKDKAILFQKKYYL